MTTNRPSTSGRERERRQGQPTEEPAWLKRVVKIGERIPDKELAKLPRDLVRDFDHYADGSPRQD